MDPGPSLARLIKITVEGDPSQEFGKLRFGGSLPTPEFLEKRGEFMVIRTPGILDLS